MIPLFKPYITELPELNQILKSGALSYGKYTIDFEEKLKEYFGTPYVIVTNSFYTAILVAISTLGLVAGDEIIASPMACLASTQPYISIGLKVRWCDIDNNRGTLDPIDLRNKISTKTKAIIHNHFCGYPGHIDEVNIIGKEFGIPVIDDGLECFGSEYKGQKIGNCGTDITVFSFNAIRIPNTIDGGAVLFNNEKDYNKSLRIRDYGIDRSSFRDSIGEINPKCDISEIGYNAMMSNVNGYIGSRQMDKVTILIKKQRENARIIKQQLDLMDSMITINPNHCSPNYWVFGILAKDKPKTIKYFREKGLYASGVHTNNSLYSIFGEQEKLHGAEDFNNHFVAIPSGWWVNFDHASISI